jgi:hypothetical protein
VSGAWVLDAPAITAFARGSIYMASLVRTLTDRGTGMLVPAVCLMEAHANAADVDLVDLLAALSSTRVVALDGEDARAAGRMWRTTPDARPAAVHAAWLAAGSTAPVVTDETGRLAGLLAQDHPVYAVPGA